MHRDSEPDLHSMNAPQHRDKTKTNGSHRNSNIAERIILMVMLLMLCILDTCCILCIQKNNRFVACLEIQRYNGDINKLVKYLKKLGLDNEIFIPFQNSTFLQNLLPVADSSTISHP